MAQVIYVSLLYDFGVVAFSVHLQPYCICDCQEFCQFLVVVKLLGILEQHFQNFVLVSSLYIYYIYLLVIA